MASHAWTVKNILDMHMHTMHDADMKLEQYLRTKNLTDAEFGEKIGLSQSQVSRIRRGVSWPSKDVLAAIAKETNNRVTANDIMKAEA